MQSVWSRIFIVCTLALAPIGCSPNKLLGQSGVTSPPASLTAAPSVTAEATMQLGAPTIAETAAPPEPPTITPMPVDGERLATEQARIIANVYNRVAPSVARIDVGGGLGSGFLIDADGHIVTNYHVVAASRGQVLVSFTDLFQTVGRVVGVDSSSDIAVVQVEKLPEGIAPVELGDSSALQVGQMTIAIGNPLGQERTVTNGIVSAIGRTIDEPGNPYAIGGAIQTDAAINPGNSGGPLLDAQSRVIGMNTAILSSSGVSSGIGFAVPANLIKKVVPALIQNGQYEHPWLGIQMRPLTTYEAERRGLPSAGILIEASSPDSPAFQAGLESRAILTAINGEPVTSADEVISFLELNTRPGDTVTLMVVGEGAQTRELRVRLGSRPSVEDIQPL
jgi:2-alkenal reductase